MPQLSLYVSEPEMCALRTSANAARMSLSGYARRALAAEQSSWPKGFWNLYGALSDETFTVPADLDEAWDRVLPGFDEKPSCISSMQASA